MGNAVKHLRLLRSAVRALTAPTEVPADCPNDPHGLDIFEGVLSGHPFRVMTQARSCG